MASGLLSFAEALEGPGKAELHLHVAWIVVEDAPVRRLCFFVFFLLKKDIGQFAHRRIILFVYL